MGGRCGKAGEWIVILEFLNPDGTVIWSGLVPEIKYTFTPTRDYSDWEAGRIGDWLRSLRQEQRVPITLATCCSAGFRMLARRPTIMRRKIRRYARL